MASSVCRVPDCTGPVRARDWCNKHYRRWLRTGDPIKVAFERGDPVTNFWAKVRRRGPNECWPWLGSRARTGHAHFVWSGGNLAHRFAYTIEIGPIPDGMHIDHTCHSSDLSCNDGNACVHRRCVNPAHLEAVVPAENQRRRHDDRTDTVIAARQRAKTHCPKGHEYTEVNTYVDTKGSRNCRACAREKARELARSPERKAYMREYYLKRKQKQHQ